MRKDQDNLLKLAQKTHETLVVSPAFQWAQDLNSVALTVKFANRPDSPSCIVSYDEKVEIEPHSIKLETMCRKLDTLTKYELSLDLYQEIDTDASIYEF